MLAENHGQFFLNFVVKTALIWLVLGGFFCVFSQSETVCNLHSCYKFALVLQKNCTPFLANQNWVIFSCILLGLKYKNLILSAVLIEQSGHATAFALKFRGLVKPLSLSVNWALLHTGGRGVICDLNCSLHLIQIAQIACVCRRAWRIKPSYDPVSNLVEYYPMLGGTAGLKTPRSTPQEHSVMRKKTAVWEQ